MRGSARLARGWRRLSGMTLIELMVVLAIVAILASVAYPSYQSQIRKAKRSDAHAALMQILLAQERWRANHVTYARNLSDAFPSGLGLASRSPEGHYRLAIDSADAIGFTAHAVALGTQAHDADCQVISLALGLSGESRTPSGCW